MGETDTQHPVWRYIIVLMGAWCVVALVWITHEMVQQHAINGDVAVVMAASGREFDRARERLAAEGEEAARYLLQELSQQEAKERSMRPVIAIEKVVRGHAWMVGTFQRWSLETELENARAENRGEHLVAVFERALDAVASAEEELESEFPMSVDEVRAIEDFTRRRRVALWGRRKRLAEALADCLEAMAGSGDAPGRLVLHDLAQLLGDESPLVRVEIARALRSTGPAALPWLIKLVERESVHPLRVVGTTDYTKGENEVRLGAENNRRRVEAVRMLSGFDSPRAKALLGVYAKDPVVGEEIRRIMAGPGR